VRGYALHLKRANFANKNGDPRSELKAAVEAKKNPAEAGPSQCRYARNIKCAVAAHSSLR
jgi:hypothetical protein